MKDFSFVKDFSDSKYFYFMPGRERAEICLENYYGSAGERNAYLDLGQTADTDTTQTDCQQSGNSSVFYDNWRKEIKIEIMIKE